MAGTATTSRAHSLPPFGRGQAQGPTCRKGGADVAQLMPQDGHRQMEHPSSADRALVGLALVHSRLIWQQFCRSINGRDRFAQGPGQSSAACPVVAMPTKGPHWATRPGGPLICLEQTEAKAGALASVPLKLRQRGAVALPQSGHASSCEALTPRRCGQRGCDLLIDPSLGEVRAH